MIDHRVSTLKEKIVSITKFGLLLSFGFLLLLESGDRVVAQEEGHIHVIVDMVQLNVAVTDKKGNYITGLRPQDFVVVEDGISEKLATFAEGTEPARRVAAIASDDTTPDSPAVEPKDAGQITAVDPQ